eukprot:scaffold23442_cov33-Tisochrysis_lutea.AAC.2
MGSVLGSRPFVRVESVGAVNECDVRRHPVLLSLRRTRTLVAAARELLAAMRRFTVTCGRAHVRVLNHGELEHGDMGLAQGASGQTPTGYTSSMPNCSRA